MDWKICCVIFCIIAFDRFQSEAHKIKALDGLKNGGNVSINFTPLFKISVTSKIVNCWWDVNSNRVLFYANKHCEPQNNVTCSKNTSSVTSTFQAQPITKSYSVFVACNPPLKGTADTITLFPHLCPNHSRFNIIPVKNNGNFGEYNSKGWFQCRNNGTPVYDSGIKRTQPTVCLPNATWEGENGLHCVKALLMGNSVFILTTNSTQLAYFTCILKGNRSSISGSQLKLQLGSKVIRGFTLNFAVEAYHNGKSVKCILIVKNETVSISQKTIEVFYGPTILNLAVVGSFEKHENSYTIQQNRTVTIYCIVDSNPLSKCTWYNLDTKLVQAAPKCDLTTNFNTTSNISCHASNGFGSTAVKAFNMKLNSELDFPVSTVPVQYQQDKLSTQLQSITTKTRETQDDRNDSSNGPLNALLIGFIVLVAIVIVVLMVSCIRK